MSTRNGAAIAIAALALVLYVSVASSDEKPAMAQADMAAPEGAAIGTVTFEQTPSGVLINVDVTDLPPGPHGIHLHEFGACTPDFSAAGGHINPDGVAHGPCATRTDQIKAISPCCLFTRTVRHERSSTIHASASRVAATIRSC